MITVLRWAERLNNSASGNPRWRLHTDRGSFITSSDASCNYEVENLLGDQKGALVEITLTRAGRVSEIVRVESR